VALGTPPLKGGIGSVFFTIRLPLPCFSCTLFVSLPCFLCYGFILLLCQSFIGTPLAALFGGFLVSTLLLSLSVSRRTRHSLFKSPRQSRGFTLNNYLIEPTYPAGPLSALAAGLLIFVKATFRHFFLSLRCSVY
jgi:hypothetical protein